MLLCSKRDTFGLCEFLLKSDYELSTRFEAHQLYYPFSLSVHASNLPTLAQLQYRR